jgi:hypothetical protein
MHTTSAVASYSRLNCRCTPGYSCTYYKQIQAIVTLNATIYEFNNDVGGVRTAFLAAMAAAANVTADHVVINGVVSHVLNPLAASRRLLSAFEVQLSIAQEFALLTAADAPPPQPAASRTLLSVKARKAVKPKSVRSEAIRVFVSVNGSGRLHQLDKQHDKRSAGLHLESRWEQSHKVRADKVEDLIEGATLVDHLFIHTPHALGAPGHLSDDVVTSERFSHLACDVVDPFTAFAGTFCDEAFQLGKTRWEQHGKAEVVELPRSVRHAQARSER